MEKVRNITKQAKSRGEHCIRCLDVESVYCPKATLGIEVYLKHNVVCSELMCEENYVIFTR